MAFFRAHSSEVRSSLLLIAACLVIYSQIAGHSFLNWGDDRTLYANPNIERGLTGEGLRWAFSHRESGQWQPLTWITYMFYVSRRGVEPGTYHSLSIFLHCLNAVLLFGALRAATGDRWRSLAAAALFAVHPLAVESVAWASQLHSLQGMFFALASLLCYGLYAKGASGARWSYGLSVALMAAALLSNPLLFALPLVLFALDRWPLARVSPPLLDKAPPVAAGALAAVVVLTSPDRIPQDFAGLADPQNSLAAMAAATAVFLSKWFWPATLSAYYPPDAYLTPPYWIGGAAALAILSLLALWQIRRRPWLAAGWLWFVLALLPAAGVRALEGAPFADGNVYAALAGLGLLLAWAVPALTGEALFHKKPARVVLGALLLVLVGRSAIRAGEWQDSLVIAEKDLPKFAVNDVLSYCYAHTLNNLGRSEEALPVLEELVKRRPKFGPGHRALAMAQRSLQRVGESEKSLEEAVRVAPNDANAWYQRAILLKNQDKLEEAAEAYRKAIELKGLPADVLKIAHDDLGVVLSKQFRFEEAIAEFDKALKIDPFFTNARRNRGVCLFNLGRFAEAEREFTSVVQVDPGDQTAQKALRYIRSGGKEPLQ
jgi:tetratricopeptide (TPR) repeat protein